MDDLMKNAVTKMIITRLKQITIVVVLSSSSIYSELNKKGMIYIGDWTPPGIKVAYQDLKVGQNGFLTRKCQFTNCFYTTEHFYFSDIKSYDVLLFNAKSFDEGGVEGVPNQSENQQYIFIGFEPAVQTPIVDTNIVFDLTWTYKLSSDIVRPFFIVKNKRGKVIGPKKYMHWDIQIEHMAPVNNRMKSRLKSKSIAAALISTQCDPKNGSLEFVQKLRIELAKCGQRVDIFGSCGEWQCLMKNEAGKLPICSVIIRKDYYFVLAFEDVFGEDYVTDKVLLALNNYAVPIVYGGANYTRFLPNGIYLNARLLGVSRLAAKMMEIINDSERYYNFFRWHEHYSFHDIYTDNQYDGICDLCALANNRTRRPNKQLVKFWNHVTPSIYDQ